ncbi:MAG: GyrI-like domain-containing protein [Clostridia bacterium]
MKYTIEEIVPQKIAYMRRTGPYGVENQKLMQELKKWAMNKNIFKNSVIYGIAQDGTDTPPEKCRYDVCIVVEDESILDNNVMIGKLQGGKYAIFTINHTAEDVQEFWQSAFEILKENNIQYDFSKPILERYKENLVNNGKCEFCVPLEN